jgi:hypothetical protein
MKYGKFLSTAFLFLLLGCQQSTSQSAESLVTPQKSLPSAKTEESKLENKTVDYFAHLNEKHKVILQNWLKIKSYLRPAVQEIDASMFQEQYKEYLDENLKMLKEAVGEKGYQYYSVGDMNQDGKTDFAVLLVDTRQPKDSKTDHFALAIFNAPFKVNQSPNYLEEGLQGITNSYINFDMISKKHLFLGKFESGVLCATYYKKKKTYYFRDCYDE